MVLNDHLMTPAESVLLGGSQGKVMSLLGTDVMRGGHGIV
jgi:hypothetical protein